MNFRFTLVFTLLAILASACAPIAASETPACTPPTSEDQIFNLDLKSWEPWDGTPRPYKTLPGSVFTFSVEDGELVVKLKPVNQDFNETEMFRRILEPQRLTAIPLASGVDDTYFVVGPIFIWVCQNGDYYINDVFQNIEIIIPNLAPESPTPNPGIQG